MSGVNEVAPSFLFYYFPGSLATLIRGVKRRLINEQLIAICDLSKYQ
jgi:hypothetical protein